MGIGRGKGTEAGRGRVQSRRKPRKHTKKSSQNLEGWAPFHNRHSPEKTRRHLCSNNIKGLHPTSLTLCEKGPDMLLHPRLGRLSKSGPRSVADGSTQMKRTTCRGVEYDRSPLQTV